MGATDAFSVETQEQHDRKEQEAIAHSQRNVLQNAWIFFCSLLYGPAITGNSFFKVNWDFFIIFLVTYNSIFLPWNFAFSASDKLSDGFRIAIEYVIDYIVDAFFLFDIYMCFRTTYFERGIEVTDLKASPPAPQGPFSRERRISECPVASNSVHGN